MRLDLTGFMRLQMKNDHLIDMTLKYKESRKLKLNNNKI